MKSLSSCHLWASIQRFGVCFSQQLPDSVPGTTYSWHTHCNPLIYPWQASPVNHALSSRTHMPDSSLTPHSMQPLSIYADTRDWIASQSQVYTFSCFHPSLCTFSRIDKHLQRHQTLHLSLESWYPVSALFLTFSLFKSVSWAHPTFGHGWRQRTAMYS